MKNVHRGVCLALVAFAAPLIAHDAPATKTSADTAVAAVSVAYLCDDGKKLTAVLDASDAKTTVSVEGDAKLQGIEMRDVMSANGNKTSNGKLVWWTKGDEGFLAEEDPPAGNGEVVLGGCKEVSAP